MKCKISDYTCPYHACMSDDCQKLIVLQQGVSFGCGHCPRDRSIESYREFFGYQNPPGGTEIVIKYAEGIKFSIGWPNCPDGEVIIEGWFINRKSTIDYAKKYEWIIKEMSIK